MLERNCVKLYTCNGLLGIKQYTKEGKYRIWQRTTILRKAGF